MWRFLAGLLFVLTPIQAPARLLLIGVGPSSPSTCNLVQDLGSDLVGYYDAAVSASVPQSAGAVATWTDPKTGFAPTNSNAAHRPTWSATSFNGQPGIAFDGSVTELAANNHPYPAGTTGGEIWVLGSYTGAGSTAGTQVAFAYGTFNVDTGLAVGRLNVSNVSRGKLLKDGSAANDTVSDLSGRHVMRLSWTASGAAMQVDNGSAFSLSNSTSMGSTYLTIGSYTNDTLNWPGVLAAIYITKPLSSGEQAEMWACNKTRGGTP